jgi:LPS export ABC transporter protein LptC
LKKVFMAAIIASATLILAGCSLDYGSAMAEDLAEDIPDTVVLGFTHTVVENGSPRFRLEAERGESYQTQQKMKLSGVRFTEYEPGTKNISARGSADSAVFFTDTESAELSGSVSFHASKDGVTVKSGYLAWDGQARQLRSRAETMTSLSDDDGSSLTGAGFSADANRRSFTFGNRADGRYSAPEPTE